MATASDIIRRSLRLIGVLDAQMAMDANDAQDALDTLNAMLAEWHEAEVGLPDYSLASLTTDLASDAGDREALSYQLALRLAPEYGAAIGPEVASMAADTMARLRLRYFQPGKVDSALPSPTYTFDIERG